MILIYNSQNKQYEAYYMGKLMIRSEKIGTIRSILVLKHYSIGETIDHTSILKNVVIH